MDHIETEVGQLAVFDEGSGPATFLWPSLYLDHASFDALIDELSRARRCIRVDGPGHGRSPGPGRAYDLAACARAAFQVLDALGVDAVDWVGNAWGGHVGVVAALASPARVTTLAAFGAPMQALSTKVRLQKHFLLAMLRFGFAKSAGGMLASAMLSPTAAAEHHALVHGSVVDAPRAGLIQAVRSISLGRPDLVDQLPRVACPALFVAGSDDAMWPPVLAAEQAARIPGGRCAVLPGAAHLGPLERPKAAAALLRSFWANRRAEGGVESVEPSTSASDTRGHAEIPTTLLAAIDD